MFKQRTSSQKPDDQLLANFRQQFPQVAATTSTTTAGVTASATESVAVMENVIQTTMSAQERAPSMSHAVYPDQDQTPRASGNEPWRFTPSLLDPNSFSFPSFPNTTAGFYAPAPGTAVAGPNNVYRTQPTDLANPALAMSMGINAPLTMPATNGTIHPGAATANPAAMMDISAAAAGFHPQALHTFQSFVQPAVSQPAFAPPAFVQPDGAFDVMDQDGSPIVGPGPGVATLSASAFPPTQGGLIQFPPGPQPPHQIPFNAAVTNPAAMASMAMLSLPPSAEKFRFHTTLNAPTAMIKDADEIPISYLNKGQAYSLSIIDTEPELPIIPGTRFRTYVRISFEDEQQRQKPGVCWSLWKEGRGTNEAHQRGGKLQAVEYVEAGQPAEGDEKRTRVELESASFDGFSVIWTPGIHGAVECNVAVRFNFLSTDFSHSKGVKGIPVRLCAKTTKYPVPLQQNVTSVPTNGSDEKPAKPTGPEICFCKVKLFRDHGAERKLSNDVAHVKKNIDKLKQQIAQAESGMKDFGKRKRSGGAAAVISSQQPKPSQDLQRVGKVPKHKRTWSMSSTSSGGEGSIKVGPGAGTNNNGGSAIANANTTANGNRLAVEEDLHSKLQNLQDMFSSTRPVSILFLRGEEQDDPDLHPVSLPGEPADLTKADSRDNLLAWRDQSGRSSVTGSSIVSPSPSSLSLHSQVSVNGGTNGANSNGTAAGSVGHWSDYHDDHLSIHHSSLSRQGTDQVTKVGKTDEEGNLSGWIEAFGVDPLYRPPPATDRTKPTACFYVLRRNGPNNNGSANGTIDGSEPAREYHRAVYLMKRTMRELVGRIAAKWKIDPRRVARTVRILPQGLEVELDDDVIAELPEGQDMVLDVIELPLGQMVKKEWDMAVDGDEEANQIGYELRLSF